MIANFRSAWRNSRRMNAPLDGAGRIHEETGTHLESNVWGGEKTRGEENGCESTTWLVTPC